MVYKTEKLNEALNKNEYMLELLEKERNKKIYDEIKKIDSIYEVKRSRLLYERNAMADLIYLNGQKSIEAILYLVNKIEDEEYRKVIIPIKYNGKYLKKDSEVYLINNFYVVGLTTDEEKVEIKQDDIYKEEDLNTPFDNFIKLVHFQKKFNDSLKINYLNETYCKYCNKMSSIIDSYISDQRFAYIKDYIRKVIDYRLDKENYKISLDEMKMLADDFANEYKTAKKLVKDIK